MAKAIIYIALIAIAVVITVEILPLAFGLIFALGALFLKVLVIAVIAFLAYFVLKAVRSAL